MAETAGLPYVVETLNYQDRVLGVVPLPNGALTVTLGLGSGLSRRPGDPPGRVWAIADRGPNLKVKLAVKGLGLGHLAHLKDVEGAKIMPMPAAGPTLCELQVFEDRVELVRALPLRTDERGICGLPPPGGPEAAMEPVFDLEGQPLGTDPDGADSEGIAALADGSFWVAEEYGPSLLKLNAEGVVEMRWTPAGLRLAGATSPVRDVLPAIASRRRLNRGFEAIAASPDGARLHVALQSAVAGEAEDVVRHWTLDAASGALMAEHRYRFDALTSFARDAEAGPVNVRDLKLCDMAWLADDRLLVLERILQTAKIYMARLRVDGGVEKTLLLSTDDAREIVADLEGMTMLSDRVLLLVNDNDFGVEGVATRFFRVTFAAPIC